MRASRMVVAIVVLAIALAGSIGGIVWILAKPFAQAHTDLHAALALRDAAQNDANEKTLEAERAKFALAADETKLSDVNKRLDALEGLASDAAIATKVGDGLADDDVAGRMSKLAELSGSASAGGEVHPVAVGVVPRAAGGVSAVPGTPAVSKS